MDKIGKNPINGTFNATMADSIDQFMPWDPFYAFNTLLVVFGMVQLVFYRPRLKKLDALSKHMWRIKVDGSSTAVYEKLSTDDTSA